MRDDKHPDELENDKPLKEGEELPPERLDEREEVLGPPPPQPPKEAGHPDGPAAA